MKIFPLALLFFCSILSAQELSSPTQNGIKVAAPSVSDDEIIEEIHSELVYPGCESFIDFGNEALKNCFHEKIRKEIHDGLAYHASELVELEENQFHSTVKFVVNKEGGISEIEITTSHPEFRRVMKEVMLKIASRVKNIQPAKLENGQAVKSLFSVPVRFVFSSE